MAFSEKIKSEVRRKSNFTCCWCLIHGIIEVHHIVPLEEGGPNIIDNAAPLCPTCHTLYGDNKKLRKMLKEKRDLLYDENSPQKLRIELRKLKTEKEKLEIFVRNIPFLKTLLFLKNIFSFDPYRYEIRKVEILFNKKQYNDAEAVLLKLVMNNIENSKIYFMLGEIVHIKSDYTRMIVYFDLSLSFDRDYEKLIEIIKYNSWVQNFNLGAEYYDKSLLTDSIEEIEYYMNKAIEAYRMAILCNSKEAPTYENLVFVLMKVERFDEAIEPVQKLIELIDNPDYYALLSDIYFTKANLIANDSNLREIENEKGIAVLEKGSAKYPDNDELISTLTNAYIITNRLEKARENLEKGIKLQPNNKYVRFSYSLLLIDSDEPDEAIINLNKILELDPEFIRAIFYKGVANYNIGVNLRNDAESNLDPNSHQFEYEVEINKSNLKFKEALVLFQKFQKLDVNNKENAWLPMWKIFTQLGMQEESKNAKIQADLLARKYSDQNCKLN